MKGDISGATQCFVLAGHPVSHSMSPCIHNAFFRNTGINAVYCALNITKEYADSFCTFLKCGAICGGNVTMPLKEKLFKHCVPADKKVEQTGAINTFKVENGKIVGYNTDGAGFIRFLRTEKIPVNTRVALFGTGGAALGILAELTETDTEVFIIGRHLPPVIAQYVNQKKAVFVSAQENEQKKMESVSKIVINATPVGMNENKSVVDVNALNAGTVVCDLIYHPAETYLMKEAGKRGCAAYNGIPMLLYQAAESFRIWTGISPDVQNIEEKIKISE